MQPNFIKVYNDVISPELSQQLISMFEESENQHEDIVLEGHRSFKQVTLQNHPEWKPFTEQLSERFFMYIEQYMKDCNITDKMFPEQFAFEQFRMKRYLPNDVDEFDNHVDVGNIDSAKRFLVFFLYLNDNEGGQTEFPQHDISVQPVTGKMVMFPPMWTHLHAGRKPINTPKYIIGSYLHYV
jgi:hypothetical protein